MHEIEEAFIEKLRKGDEKRKISYEGFRSYCLDVFDR